MMTRSSERSGPPSQHGGGDSEAGAARGDHTIVEFEFLMREARNRLDPELRKAAESGDLAHDVLVERLSNPASSTPRRDLRSWSRRLVSSLEARLESLRKARREILFDLLEADEELTDTGEVSQDQSSQLDCLRRALSSLSPDHRQAIELRDLARLPFAEVGERMGRSADAARMLHVRAKIELAREMGNLGRRQSSEPG